MTEGRSSQILNMSCQGGLVLKGRGVIKFGMEGGIIGFMFEKNHSDNILRDRIKKIGNGNHLRGFQ